MADEMHPPDDGFDTWEPRDEDAPTITARRSALRVVKAKAEPKHWRTPAERALKLGELRERLATGYATLDDAMRGGFPVGRLVVVGGPPGASKTNLLVNLAHRWRVADYTATMYAADEDGDGLLVREGQLEGFARDDLESGNESVRTMLHDRLASTPRFDLVDQEESDVTIEDAADAMFIRAEGKPCVFLADSVQTLRTRVAADDETPRAKVNAAMRGLRAIARRGALVLASSEMARGFYRARRRNENSTALSAFKESGGVEYGAAVALAMVEDPEAEGHFIVEVAKNRLGKKPTLRLRLDYATATLAEVAMPVVESTAQTPKANMAAVKRAVLAVVKAEPGLTSKNAICTRVTGGNKTVKLQAIAELLEERMMVDLGDAGGFRAT
jgi:predicted ATP-dependent serine protease